MNAADKNLAEQQQQQQQEISSENAQSTCSSVLVSHTYPYQNRGHECEYSEHHEVRDASMVSDLSDINDNRSTVFGESSKRTPKKLSAGGMHLSEALTSPYSLTSFASMQVPVIRVSQDSADYVDPFSSCNKKLPTLDNQIDGYLNKLGLNILTIRPFLVSYNTKLNSTIWKNRPNMVSQNGIQDSNNKLKTL
jgi:hypothetical protein